MAILITQVAGNLKLMMRMRDKSKAINEDGCQYYKSFSNLTNRTFKLENEYVVISLFGQIIIQHSSNSQVIFIKIGIHILIFDVYQVSDPFFLLHKYYVLAAVYYRLIFCNFPIPVQLVLFVLAYRLSSILVGHVVIFIRA